MKTNARIYVMRDAAGRVKVGHSRRVEKRRKELGDPDVLHLTDIKEQVERIERCAHRLLTLAGRHDHGEWFNATLAEAIEAIERAERICNGEELPLDAIAPKQWTVVDVPGSFRPLLDALRRQEPDLPSRSEMVRRLIIRAAESARTAKAS